MSFELCCAVLLIVALFECACFSDDLYNSCVAEASCAAAIRTARSAIADFGEEQARSVKGLVELAHCSENHSERDTRNLMSKKLGLSLPMPISYVEVKGWEEKEQAKVPMLRLRHWAGLLLKFNCWHLLCGLRKPHPRREQAIWKAWWEKYRAIEPSHPIYEMAAKQQIDLARCPALVLHGDEGRGRRRQAYLVLNVASVLGRGSAPAMRSQRATAVKKPFLKMKTNFRGHSYTTRFLVGTLTRRKYGDNEEVLESLLQSVAQEAVYMMTQGVADRYGNRHFMCILKTVGDWPWLQKSGHLNRTYNNCVKWPSQKAGGLCHMCDCGPDSVPFEQINTRKPVWQNSMFRTPPFEKPPAMAQVPHAAGHLAGHFAWDVFHTVHLGVGRNLAGNMLALLSDLEVGNIDARFEALTVKYKAWCKIAHKTPFVGRLTKELISWPTMGDFPSGSWYKAGLTTTILLWVESLAANLNIEDEPMLDWGMEATIALNEFLRVLFRNDAWLSTEVARLAGEFACKFLRRYAQCAKRALHTGRVLWALQPKLHSLHHVAVSLLAAADAGHEACNPLLFSAQIAEDFIGRPSRLSRRVTSRGTCLRVMERYLQSAHHEWCEAGLLVRTQ